MTPPFRIVGAGPAGLAAAITLAAAGRAVEVFERRRECGARFGGDLQGLENWTADEDAEAELARTGLDADFYRAPFREGFQANGRRVDRMTFPRPAFYLVKRGRDADTLDQGLKRRALDAGVHLRLGESCDPATADVLATGPRGRRPFAVDRGVVFRTDAPDLAVAYLDDRVAYKGYAYLLVTGGYGCLCTMLFDRFAELGRAFADARTALLDRWPIRRWDERPVGGVGHWAGVPTWTSGRTLVVGEAAGLQDFLWGFGIRAALRSGVLAARALLDAPASAPAGASSEAAVAYTAAADAAFGPFLRGGVVNRALWEAGRVARYAPTMTALRWGGPYALLRALHRDTPVQRALYPAARRYVRRAYPHLAV